MTTTTTTSSKPLRVGVDLTGIWRPRTGIFRYAAELATHLLELPPSDPPIRYVFFFAREPHPEFAPRGAAFDTVICPTTNELVIKQAWFPMMLPRLRLDVTHYPSFPPPLLLPLGPRTVMTFHDAGPWRHPDALTAHGRVYFRTLLARGLRTSARVITPSHHARSEIGRLFGTRYLRKVSVVPEAAWAGFGAASSATHQAAVRARYDLPQQYLLAVATNEPRKNLHTLLTAYQQVRQQLGAACPPLVIVGRVGWNGGDPRQASLAGGDVSVRNTGFVSDADLVALYQMATCLVFPSLYEGFGLPLVEAMTAGCPVISSAAASLPEVAGEAAVLVDPHDAVALAAAMGRVLADERLRARMIRAGHRRAARYSWDETARLTREAYLVAAGVRHSSVALRLRPPADALSW